MAKIISQFVNYNFDIFLVYVLINFFFLYNFNNINPDSYLLILANTLLISSIYLLNKKSDKDEDVLNNSNVSGNLQNKILQYYISANVLSFLLYIILNWKLLPFWFIFFTLGLLYSYPKKYKLKRFFILKNLMPAFCWYLSFCLLISLNSTHDLLQIFKSSISTFYILFLFEILWDMPDRIGDKITGTKTFPVVLGFDNTRKALFILNLVALIISPIIISKIVSLLILAFLLFINEDTQKNVYHFLILFISLTYLVLMFFAH